MRNKVFTILICLMIFAFYKLAQASYFPFSDTGSSSNLGIGTNSAFGGKLIVMGGNVGIGSLVPGSVLDVQGTTRATGFQLNTNPSGGYVLVSGATGIGTWMAASTLPVSAGSAGGSPSQLQYNSGGTFAGIVNSNVDASGNVGFGTTLSANKLDVQGGVGIGSAYAGYKSAPSNSLIVEGNVGIGTTTPQTGLVVLNGNVGIGTWTADGGRLIIAGTNANIGIGTAWPGAAIDIRRGQNAPHYVRIKNTTTGGSSNAGFILINDVNLGASLILNTVSGSGIGALTITNNDEIKIITNANVGSGGTDDLSIYTGGTGAANRRLTVTAGGNVGIGTHAPFNALTIVGNVGIASVIASSYVSTTAPIGGMIIEGNVGIGTLTAANGKLIVKNGNVGIGTVLVPSALTLKGSFSQIVNTLTNAASVATDASLGNHFRLTTTQNFTLSNPTNATDGQRVVWEIIQDATGSRTIALDTKFSLGTDIAAVTLTTTASKRDFLIAIYSVVTDKWYVVGFVKGY